MVQGRPRQVNDRDGLACAKKYPPTTESRGWSLRDYPDYGDSGAQPRRVTGDYRGSMKNQARSSAVDLVQTFNSSGIVAIEGAIVS